MALSAARHHADSEGERESVGIIDGSYQYVPLPNASTTPGRDFLVPTKLWARVIPTALAVLHSHPGERYAFPSAADQAAQQATGLPWAILPEDGPETWFGTPRPMEPLWRRGFVWGVTDCYGFIRDAYQFAAGISLPDYAREWAWWERAEPSPYDAHTDAAGFVTVEDGDELRPGDVMLFAIRSRGPNHAGLYVGNGIMGHHLCGRLPVDSTRLPRAEPIGRWLPYLVRSVRYAQD